MTPLEKIAVIGLIAATAFSISGCRWMPTIVGKEKVLLVEQDEDDPDKKINAASVKRLPRQGRSVD